MIPTSRTNCIRTVLSVGAVLALAASAQAAFTLVDNFESYTTGNAVAGTGSNAFSNNTGPWNAVAGSSQTVRETNVAIADDSGNKVLSVGGANLGARLNSAPDIANGDASNFATYFFQVKNSDTTPNITFGLSDTTVTSLTTSTIFGDFEVQASLATNVTAFVGYRNGATNTISTTAAPVSTWINVWLVVDNFSNNWAIDTSTGTDAAASIASAIAFRNAGTTNPLTAFMVAAANNDAASLFVDNIYADLTGANLLNPTAVPEPSSFAALAGLSALGFVASRRRRAA